MPRSNPCRGDAGTLPERLECLTLHLEVCRDVAIGRGHTRVSQVIADDGKLEQALEIELPEPFDAWLNRGLARFEANVRTRYLKMRK